MIQPIWKWDEFSIRVDGRELINSRAHHSEQILAELASRKVAGKPRAAVLTGGLGIGFTAAHALRSLRPDATVVVAELVPALIAWNRQELAELTGQALLDPRITILESDLVELIENDEPRSYDAIIMDVDNGPQGLSRPKMAGSTRSGN